MAFGIYPWLATQGSRLGKIPLFTYAYLVWLATMMTMVVTGNGALIPTAFVAGFIMLTGHYFSTIGLQSSGATMSNPERTPETAVIIDMIGKLQVIFEEYKAMEEKRSTK